MDRLVESTIKLGLPYTIDPIIIGLFDSGKVRKIMNVRNSMTSKANREK